MTITNVGLVYCILFITPLIYITFIWRHYHYLWRAAKFKTFLGTYGLLTRGWGRGGGSLSCRTCLQWLKFCRFIWITTPFSHLVPQHLGYWGLLVTLVLSSTYSCKIRFLYSLHNQIGPRQLLLPPIISVSDSAGANFIFNVEFKSKSKYFFRSLLTFKM